MISLDRLPSHGRAVAEWLWEAKKRQHIPIVFLGGQPGFPFVDAGHGWLIFGLPAAESAFHPAEANDRHELYLLCDDLQKEILGLRAKGVDCAGVVEAPWGSVTKVPLPGGGHIGLYQPRHLRP